MSSTSCPRVSVLSCSSGGERTWANTRASCGVKLKTTWFEALSIYQKTRSAFILRIMINSGQWRVNTYTTEQTFHKLEHSHRNLPSVAIVGSAVEGHPEQE